MFVKGLRKFLYAGALLALAPIMARADAPAPCPTPCPAPTTCKVRVLECVQVPCEYTRTTYKPVTREETYTTYKCETITENKTRQVTVYNKVCETVNETRTIVKKVPVWEDRVEYKTVCKKVQVTEMKTKTVHGGHWECCTAPAGPSVLDRLCGKCPDPCATRTVKKWVPECHTECVPVCCTKTVKECVPVCKKVCTYKCVNETVVCPVQRVRCVPETRTVNYTECRKVSVPVQCKRTVTVCVPVNEVVKGTKTVSNWVEKEVPVAPCSDVCDTDTGCGKGHLAGFKGRRGGHGCCK